MGDLDFTAAHLEQLRRVDDGREFDRAQGFAPLGGPAIPDDLRDLAAWGLVHWDAGAGTRDRATLAERSPLERLRDPQHRVTAAGRIVLELALKLTRDRLIDDLQITTDKCSGHTAFEAYSDSVSGVAHTGRAIPAWAELPEHIRLAWVVGVKAAIADEIATGRLLRPVPPAWEPANRG